MKVSHVANKDFFRYFEFGFILWNYTKRWIAITDISDSYTTEERFIK